MIVGLLADIVDCLFIVASKRLYAHCGSDLLYFRIHIAKATEKIHLVCVGNSQK